MAELAETCNKIGKNIGGTNQSLSESLVAQTIILDEQKLRYRHHQVYQEQQAQGILPQSIQSPFNIQPVTSQV